jgi:transposase InsO family protein
MLKSQGRSFEIHQKPTILTSISKWKWENICMDFIVGLSRTSRGYNSIWIIVDRLTKLAHLILVSTAYRIRQYVKLYMSYIIRYHGIPKTIISDRGSIFVAHFWEQLHECLGTHLIRSSTYHPQTNGQTERVNQIIKDMLHACVLTDDPKWDKHLPLGDHSTLAHLYAFTLISGRDSFIKREGCNTTYYD